MFGQESVANDISDYYGDKSGEKEVQQFCEVHNAVATTLFHHFVSIIVVHLFELDTDFRVNI